MSEFSVDFLLDSTYLVFWLIPAVVLLSTIITIYLTGSKAIRQKYEGFVISWIHLFFSKDRKWVQPGDAGVVLEKVRNMAKDPNAPKVPRKKVYFVRHGESMWNEVFNKGFNVGFPLRLLQGILREISLLSLPDSLFWDSPLSKTGWKQATLLLTWIEAEGLDNTHAAVLKGLTGTAVLCSSNLRRAISTSLCALASRLLRNKSEKVHILSSLQEMTRNVDGYALSEAGRPPTPSWFELSTSSCEHIVSFYGYNDQENGTISDDGRLDCTKNFGSKTMKSNGLDRMLEFCEWVFTGEPTQDCDTVIAAGHSLYFREFFKAFLPRKLDLSSKKHKMVNCGVVCFELVKLGKQFVIDPDTFEIVYGGFEGQKKLNDGSLSAHFSDFRRYEFFDDFPVAEVIEKELHKNV